MDRVRRSWLMALLASLVCLPIPGGAQTQDADDPNDLKLMAQKANNPLSDVWLLITQNDYTYFDGDLVDGTRQVNSVKFQPVMPVPVLEGDWNLIFRPVFTYNSVPLDDDVGDLFGLGGNEIVVDPSLRAIATDPWGRTSGLGDTVLLTLLGPNRLDGFVWGLGVSQIFPTAHEDVLGQEKWQIGPAALAVQLGKESGHLGLESWNLGFLAQHWWSYAGDGDRRETAQSDIQYFINWKMNDTQLVGMTPNIRIDWKADNFKDAVSLPVGLGTIGMFKLGRLPIRWGVEFQYYLIQPDDAAPRFNIKIFFAPIILNPFK